MAPVESKALTCDSVVCYHGTFPDDVKAELSSIKPQPFPEDAMYVLYTVRPGDTFLCIAKRLTGDNANSELFMNYSGVTDARTLRAGTDIRLPFHFKGVDKEEECYFRWSHNSYEALGLGGGGITYDF